MSLWIIASQFSRIFLWREKSPTFSVKWQISCYNIIEDFLIVVSTGKINCLSVSFGSKFEMLASTSAAECMALQFLWGAAAVRKGPVALVLHATAILPYFASVVVVVVNCFVSYFEESSNPGSNLDWQQLVTELAAGRSRWRRQKRPPVLFLEAQEVTRAVILTRHSLRITTTVVKLRRLTPGLRQCLLHLRLSPHLILRLFFCQQRLYDTFVVM